MLATLRLESDYVERNLINMKKKMGLVLILFIKKTKKCKYLNTNFHIYVTNQYVKFE